MSVIFAVSPAKRAALEAEYGSASCFQDAMEELFPDEEKTLYFLDESDPDFLKQLSKIPTDRTEVIRIPDTTPLYGSTQFRIFGTCPVYGIRPVWIMLPKTTPAFELLRRDGPVLYLRHTGTKSPKEILAIFEGLTFYREIYLDFEAGEWIITLDCGTEEALMMQFFGLGEVFTLTD